MKRVVILMLAIAATLPIAAATDYIQNVYGRQIQMLNGKWGAIVDQYDRGLKKKIYANPHPKGKTDFYEYDLDGSSRLNVPGDWNSQRQELRCDDEFISRLNLKTPPSSLLRCDDDKIF